MPYLRLCLLAVWSLCFIGTARADQSLIPQWIWASRHPLAGQQAYFRREFELSGDFTAASLMLHADDTAKVWLNGQAVAEFKAGSSGEIVSVTGSLRRGRNVLAVSALNRAGYAGVLARLTVSDNAGRSATLVTDPWWRASDNQDAPNGWNLPDTVTTADWHWAESSGLDGTQPWGNPTVEHPDYHQWKLARGASDATGAVSLHALPGVQVELARTSRESEGSWISLAFDDSGRMLVGREGAGILRTSATIKSPPEPFEIINNTLLECRGLLWERSRLFANANNSKGLYRLTSSGTGDLHDVQLLHATGGGVGHGRNDLRRGTDGRLYVIHGNDVMLPEDFHPGGSPLIHYANDRPTRCAWDRYLFDARATLPAGHVIRTNDEGSVWHLYAGGMRNPYGIDFNVSGDMFTFDADNEGDMGAPWYRPTRVTHITSGADFGWRQGTANRPEWYPDHSPVTLNIGKSSPTAVRFGHAGAFPEPYRSALSVLDWSYGRIYAIHLIPRRSSYVATAEVFLEGRPLNVTDLEWGPDGALYFCTGGRGTQSGIYRATMPALDAQDKFTLTLQGLDERSAAAAHDRSLAIIAHNQRVHLETWHKPSTEFDLPEAIGFVGSTDPMLRQAARIAIEHQPVETWTDAALNDSRPLASATLLMSLARSGGREQQPLVVNRLCKLLSQALSPDEQLTALRALGISFARHGVPEGQARAACLGPLQTGLGSSSHFCNLLAAELLAVLEDPTLVARAVPLLTDSHLQEEALAWLFVLRNVRTGWTPATRREYFSKLRVAESFVGGRDMPTFLYSIRIEALRHVSDAERATLADLLIRKPTETIETSGEAREIVQEWTLHDFETELAANPTTQNAERGAQIFAEARCVSCHRSGTRGQPVGPDLTRVDLRLGRKDLLDAILNPSKSLDEKFRQKTWLLKSGLSVTGRIVTGDDESMLISTDPLKPDLIRTVRLDEIESVTDSRLSPMPAGLLNSFSKAEILDLLEYLSDATQPRASP